MTEHSPKWTFLISNADDFGYYGCVSRGIAKCGHRGAITATGIMANGPHFDTLKTLLFDLPHIDMGVHLNLTYGVPLTKTCRNLLAQRGGAFCNKIETAALIVRNALPLAIVKAEWRAQIVRCLESGLKIFFLNSHEHIHLLPMLSLLADELAKEYGIRHLRHPRPEWTGLPVSFTGIMRNLLIHLVMVFGGSRHKPIIQMIGNAVSGKLTLDYLRKCLTGLVPSRAYELMCHPGCFDPSEIKDQKLCRFHNWEQELALLIGPEFKSLLLQNRIRLSRYSELSPGFDLNPISGQDFPAAGMVAQTQASTGGKIYEIIQEE